MNVFIFLFVKFTHLRLSRNHMISLAFRCLRICPSWIRILFSELLYFFMKFFYQSLSQWWPFYQVIFNFFMKLKIQFQSFNFLLKFLILLQLYSDVFRLILNFIFILLILDDQKSFLFFIWETFEISITILNNFLFVLNNIFFNFVVFS